MKGNRMIRDEIMNMPAGKEMDALIAEEVMGEAMPIYSHDHYNVLEIKYSAQECWYCLPEWSKGDVCEWLPFPFSDNIAAAWKVVEKLHNDFSISLSYDDPQTIEEIKWNCELYAKDEPYKDFEARADTAPLAIGRTALLAVMEF